MKQFIDVSSFNISFEGTHVIENLSLKIKKGELVSIVGPFGSGKTTLLKAIAGLLDSYTGTIKIDNKTPLELRKSSKIGYCFQQPTLLPWLNVEENLLLPAKLCKTDPYLSPDELLTLVNAKNIKNLKISSLSGGTQQLVAILRSLSLNPEILLLDEPFASIDEINRESLQYRLLKIHSQTKKTTILITHSINEAIYLSNRVIVFSNKPTSIKKIIDIKINRNDPKIRTSKEFTAFTEQIKEAFNA